MTQHNDIANIYLFLKKDECVYIYICMYRNIVQYFLCNNKEIAAIVILIIIIISQLYGDNNNNMAAIQTHIYMYVHTF